MLTPANSPVPPPPTTRVSVGAAAGSVRAAVTGSPRLSPALSVLDAAEMCIRDRFASVSAALEGLHENPTGAREVHALRVATRKAAAAVTVFRPHVDGTLARKVIGRLRRVRRAAGKVRACDVQEEMLVSIERAGPPEALVAAELLVGRIAKRRERARAQLVSRRQRFRPEQAGKFAERLTGSLRLALSPLPGTTIPAFTHSGSPATIADAAREALARAAKRFTDALDIEHARDDFERLHQKRLAGKRLRYAVELLTPFVEEDPAESAVSILRRMQDRLGELNDRHELARLVASVPAELHLRPGSATSRSFETLRLILVAERDRMLDQFETWWAAKSPRLAAALARLGAISLPSGHAAVPASELELEFDDAVTGAMQLVLPPTSNPASLQGGASP